jgi:hypothetical protein
MAEGCSVIKYTPCESAFTLTWEFLPWYELAERRRVWPERNEG